MHRFSNTQKNRNEKNNRRDIEEKLNRKRKEKKQLI